jgi:hypothetical protein
MIDGLLAWFCEAALRLLYLRLQLLGQLLNLLGEYRLKHQVIATRGLLLSGLRNVHAECTYLMRSAHILLGTWPRRRELLRVFDCLRVRKRRAGLGHTPDVPVVPEDLIIVGLVVRMEGSSYSVLSSLASEAEGVCLHIVIQDARWVRMRGCHVCAPVF